MISKGGKQGRKEVEVRNERGCANRERKLNGGVVTISLLLRRQSSVDTAGSFSLLFFFSPTTSASGTSESVRPCRPEKRRPSRRGTTRVKKGMKIKQTTEFDPKGNSRQHALTHRGLNYKRRCEDHGQDRSRGGGEP